MPEDTSNAVPTPGSNEALNQGCTCPVLDNAHGKGAYGGVGNLFWYAEGCPVHTPGDAKEDHDVAGPVPGADKTDEGGRSG